MLASHADVISAQTVPKDRTVYASGPRSAKRQMAPVFDGFAKNCFDLGVLGNGMKMNPMANVGWKTPTMKVVKVNRWGLASPAHPTAIWYAEPELHGSSVQRLHHMSHTVIGF